MTAGSPATREQATARLAAVEAEITAHLAAIAVLREEAVPLLADTKTPGQEARLWLVDRGATDEEARNALVAIILERRAAREESE